MANLQQKHCVCLSYWPRYRVRLNHVIAGPDNIRLPIIYILMFASSLHCGLYTTSVNFGGKMFCCNVNRITECDINNTLSSNSSNSKILLYKVIMWCPSHGDVIKWKHFSALLALCAGNSPVPGEFPIRRPVTRSFDIFFDLRLNKRLSKQW